MANDPSIERGAIALDEVRAKRARQPVAAPLDTHQAYASEYIAAVEHATGHPPVYCEGELWIANAALYRPKHQRELRNELARRFDGRKRADTQRSVVQIAERVCDLAFEPDFFARAAVGVATPSNFWAIENNELVRRSRNAKQCQRFELPVDPAWTDSGAPAAAPAWDQYLAQAFKGKDRDAQIAMLQEVAGGALLGLLATLQLVVLLLGVTRAGKGVFARVLEALFPHDAVCSVSPDRWGHEYHRAALAGKKLNLAGEVDESRPIPGADFKSISGFDLVGARNPNHAAFTFRNSAAHVFSGNTFPEARDRDEAFYGRWLIIEFPNSFAGREDVDLPRRLIDDCLPAILAWALLGAERLARRGRFDPPARHHELLNRWRVEHSSVLTFLRDRDAVLLFVDLPRKKRADAKKASQSPCAALTSTTRSAPGARPTNGGR